MVLEFKREKASEAMGERNGSEHKQKERFETYWENHGGNYDSTYYFACFYKFGNPRSGRFDCNAISGT